MHRGLVVIGVMLFGACAPERNAAPHVGSLAASATAQQLGIGSYVVGADRVELLDREGRSIGLLWVTPRAQQRDVEISFFDDAEHLLNEVTDPVNGRFVAPASGEDRAGAVQADPALAAYFARFDLRFVGIEPGRAEPTLQAQEVSMPSCANITFVAECTPEATCFGWSATEVARGTICDPSFTLDTDCPSLCQNAGYGGGFFDTEYCAEGGCVCQTVLNVAKRYAKCPTTVGCYQGDYVAKKRSCLSNGGSCSNQALGFACCGQFTPAVTQYYWHTAYKLCVGPN